MQDVAQGTAVSSPSRPPIPKKLRFEVFKRDSFTCQYCGRRAPDVILHCDHVKAVADGGATDILNLVTACVDCNLGKGPRKLTDHAALTKQMIQLTMLQEKREQIEMMLAWRAELDRIDEIAPAALERRWCELTDYSLTDVGRASLRKLIKRFGIDAVTGAMQEAVDKCVEKDEDGKATLESVAEAFDYVGRIAAVTDAEEKEPGSRKMFYIRGILRNRLHYCPEWKALAVIKEAFRCGVPLELIEEIAKGASSWTRFVTELDAVTAEALEQAEAKSQWQESMLELLRACFGETHTEAGLALVSRALSVGMSQRYLLELIDECRDFWEKFENWLERNIEWRVRLLALLRKTFGSALPHDDRSLNIVGEAVDMGMADSEILEAASTFRNWSGFSVYLDEWIDAAVGRHIDELRAAEETPAAPAAMG